MNQLTQSILNELRKDGRASYTDIAETLGTSREKVAHTVKPLLQSGQLLIYAAIHPWIMGKNVGVHLLIRIEGPLSGVLDSVVAMNESVFVSETTGAFQVMAELHTESINTCQTSISQIRSLPGVVDVSVHVYQQIISSFFLGPEPEPTATDYDNLDLAIMRHLKEDGRAILRDISDAVGLSPAAVRARMMKLQSSGIMKIGALKQRSDMSDDFLFGLGINTAGPDQEALNLLIGSGGLEFLARSVGRFDYLATANFNSLREFNNLVTALRTMECVTYTEQWLHVRIGYEKY